MQRITRQYLARFSRSSTAFSGKLPLFWLLAGEKTEDPATLSLKRILIKVQYHMNTCRREPQLIFYGGLGTGRGGPNRAKWI